MQKSAGPDFRKSMSRSEPFPSIMLRDLIGDRHCCCFMPSTWIGSATAGFDHAQALIQIGCPVLLHADFETQENGTFNGAIDQEDANRI